MTAVSRSAQFAKVHKVLKKHYKPSLPVAGRSVLEHLLFACCLEDARHDAAEEAFAALVHTFFDWNEVRVTSISELSEVMACLPDPRAAANRVKRVLHSVFEATFDFNLEEYRKKTLGPTVEWLRKLDGVTPYAVSYTVQAALGGHSIPIDGGTMAALRVLGLVSEQDAAAGVVPGLERAVAKSKGPEFAALLHELGADFAANPYSAAVREILLQIEPECAGRMPKRRLSRAERKSLESPAAQPAAAAPVEPPEKKPVKKKPTQAEPAADEPIQKKTAEAPAAVETPKKRTSTAETAPEATKKKLPDKSKSANKNPLAKRKPR